MTGRYITQPCTRPRICPDCGVPECPAGYLPNEDTGETWDEACGRCEDRREQQRELAGDMRRDEA